MTSKDVENSIVSFCSATLTTVVSRIAMMAPRTTTEATFRTPASSASPFGAEPVLCVVRRKKSPSSWIRPREYRGTPTKSSADAVRRHRVREPEQRPQLQPDPRAAEREHAPQPAVEAAGRDAAEVRADVAAARHPRADAHHDPAQDGGDRRAPRDRAVDLPRARGRGGHRRADHDPDVGEAVLVLPNRVGQRRRVGLLLP